MSSVFDLVEVTPCSAEPDGPKPIQTLKRFVRENGYDRSTLTTEDAFAEKPVWTVRLYRHERMAFEHTSQGTLPEVVDAALDAHFDYLVDRAADIDEMVQKNDVCKAEIQRREADIDTLTRQKSDRESALAQRKAEVELLACKVARRKADIERRTADLDALDRKIEDCRTDIAWRMAEMDALTKEIGGCEAAMRDPWEPKLSEAFRREYQRLTYDNIWDVLGVPTAGRTLNRRKRLRRVLKRLGFRSLAVKSEGGVEKGWARG